MCGMDACGRLDLVWKGRLKPFSDDLFDNPIT